MIVALEHLWYHSCAITLAQTKNGTFPRRPYDSCGFISQYLRLPFTHILCFIYTHFYVMLLSLGIEGGVRGRSKRESERAGESERESGRETCGDFDRVGKLRALR